MATVNRPGVGTATVTISGTSGVRYVLGPPVDPLIYNKQGQGRHVLESAGAYRWVVDEPTNTASPTTYSYDSATL